MRVETWELSVETSELRLETSELSVETSPKRRDSKIVGVGLSEVVEVTINQVCLNNRKKWMIIISRRILFLFPFLSSWLIIKEGLYFIVGSKGKTTI